MPALFSPVSILQVDRDSKARCPNRKALGHFILLITVMTCYRLPVTGMQEASSEAIDRRPIATRNRKWAQAATIWLASRNVSPNAISIAGMCACIVAGIALGATSIADYRILWLIAALGAQLRLTANMLDVTLICVSAAITPRSWQMIHFSDLRIGLMTLGLAVIIVGCVITVIRRVGRIAHALGA